MQDVATKMVIVDDVPGARERTAALLAQVHGRMESLRPVVGRNVHFRGELAQLLKAERRLYRQLCDFERQPKSSEQRPAYTIGEAVNIECEWFNVAGKILKIKADGRLKVETGALLEVHQVVMIKDFAYEVRSAVVRDRRSITIANLAPFRGDRSAPAAAEAAGA